MQELFPILFGLILGAGLGFVRPSMRLPVGAVLAIVLGVLATVITGEFKSSWGYLLIDIPLVAVGRDRRPAGRPEGCTGGAALALP